MAGVTEQAVGSDGWPDSDPKPPPPDIELPAELLWPKNIRPSAIPLTIVCGPPAAGKSWFVAQQRSPDDEVIDLDDIVQEIGGDARTVDRAIRKRALRERNDRLRELAVYAGNAAHAWFITTAASASARRQWARLLKPQRVLVMLTPIEECLRRVRGDIYRARVAEDQTRIIEAWWGIYSPWDGDTAVRTQAQKP